VPNITRTGLLVVIVVVVVVVVLVIIIIIIIIITCVFTTKRTWNITRNGVVPSET